MANKTSVKSTKVGRRSDKSAKRVAAKASKPRKTARSPRSRQAVKPANYGAMVERLHAIQAGTKGGKSASQLISMKIAELGGWRGDVLRHVRKLIKEADPGVGEEVKWKKPSNPAGVPLWSHAGIICTGETYKEVVKLTFFKGASLRDPAALFNSSLDGNVRRAIDIREGDEIDESAFKDLIRAAVSLNLSGKKKPAATKPKGAAPASPRSSSNSPRSKLVGA